MSDPSSGAGRSTEGILANLPRTRPQRSTARRDAARQAAAGATSESTKPARAGATGTARKRTPAKKGVPAKASTGSRAKSTAKRLQDPAPRQGFEAESDPVSGPVQPPGGVDLLTSAAELAGELTKTGLSTGARLLKDALSRLPLN
jgi:hypothetical protein